MASLLTAKNGPSCLLNVSASLISWVGAFSARLISRTIGHHLRCPVSGRQCDKGEIATQGKAKTQVPSSCLERDCRKSAA